MINRFAGTFYLEQFSYIISLVYGLRPFYSAVVNLDRFDLPLILMAVSVKSTWVLLDVRTPGICHLLRIIVSLGRIKHL